MRIITNVLREFFTVVETAKVSTMLRHAAAILTNTLTFPAIPHNNVAVKAAALLLQDMEIAKDGSKEAQDNYDAQLEVCNEIMEANYNYVDLVGGGDSAINLLAGCNSESDNTSRTAAPGTPENIKLSYTRFGNQIKIEWETEDLSYGAVIISTTDATVTVVQSGPMQIKVTCGTTVIFIDLATKNNAVIANLTAGTTIVPSVVFFNPNGLSPIIKTTGKLVPSA
jgi:hypothetical protein